VLEHTFVSHVPPAQGYEIRQVGLYGVTECIRSAMAPRMLRSGDVRGFGRLITVGHDGDRVSERADGGRVPSRKDFSDERFAALIADAESGDPERTERARLWRQPGGYDASTEELDTLVDLALDTDGVVGAGLVGAGLGGSIVAVVEGEAVHTLFDRFRRDYYAPRGLPPAAEAVRPVGGAGVLELP